MIGVAGFDAGSTQEETPDNLGVTCGRGGQQRSFGVVVDGLEIGACIEQNADDLGVPFGRRQMKGRVPAVQRGMDRHALFQKPAGQRGHSQDRCKVHQVALVGSGNVAACTVIE